MSFILLTTGQVVEVAETRAQVRTLLAGTGPALTVTTGGGSLDLRAAAIVGISDSRAPFDFVNIGSLMNP